MRALVVVLFGTALGCAAGAPRAPAESAPAGPPAAAAGLATPPGVVGAGAARRLVAAGVKVVDVRTPAEFAAGHLPGAVNVPYDEVAARAAELGPPSTPLLLYCRTGRRSGIAAQTLAAKGFTTVYDLQSYDLWVASEPAPAR